MCQRCENRCDLQILERKAAIFANSAKLLKLVVLSQKLQSLLTLAAE